MNPYAEEPGPKIQSATDLFGRLVPQAPRSDGQKRNDLLKAFSKKLNRPIGYVAMRCTGLSLADLYYIQSVADKYELEGKGAWGRAFNGMLKPRE